LILNQNDNNDTPELLEQFHTHDLNIYVDDNLNYFNEVVDDLTNRKNKEIFQKNHHLLLNNFVDKYLLDDKEH